MAEIDYINTLGAGAGFDSKSIVEALVNAEKAPTENRIQRKIDTSEAQISAIGQAISAFNELQEAAKTLDDLSDFSNFTTSNSAPTAMTVSASSGASTGAHSVGISSIAKEQRTTITPDGASVFTSSTQLLNSGNTFSIDIAIGSPSATTHSVAVSTATPQGIVDAINAQGLDVSAQLIDQGTAGTNYVIQLVGKSGTANQFSFTPSVNSMLSASTPSAQAASDATITVNGIQFTRSTNKIEDVIPGVTLSINSTTSSDASVTITQDTAEVKTKIESLVSTYNNTMTVLNGLTDAELEGDLKGDSIFKRSVDQIRDTLIGVSSTPGTTITRLSDIGVSITKTGTLEVSDSTLTTALSNSLPDVRKLFSADTEQQTNIGDASRGIAGDIVKAIADLKGSSGYLTTKTAALGDDIADYREEMTALEERMEALQARYTKQFAAMNNVVNEMNNTRDNLISSFENLPFTSKNK